MWGRIKNVFFKFEYFLKMKIFIERFFLMGFYKAIKKILNEKLKEQLIMGQDK
jgi:hypothetical protein